MRNQFFKINRVEKIKMASAFICDGCKKTAWAHRSPDGHIWVKPPNWYQRSDKDGIQDACSRECIELIAAKTGKTKTVLPW